jgi:16S rRNA (uracil1498-N3)-methyltransferase
MGRTVAQKARIGRCRSSIAFVIRLPVPKERIADRVVLTRAERHYLADVLRLGPGAQLEVFDGEGRRFAARLVSTEEMELTALAAQERSARTIVLAQALSKGEKMDLVVQKATELGADAIHPWRAARSVVKLDERHAAERVRRWQRIAEQASRQCGRAVVPPVRPVGALDDVLAQAKVAGALVLVLFEKERARRLSEALAQTAGPVVLVVGPEGGWSAEEIARAEKHAAVPVSLGRSILRTETAGLAALCVARFLEGELG